MSENLQQYGFRILQSGTNLLQAERDILIRASRKGLFGTNFIGVETMRSGIVSVDFNPNSLTGDTLIGLRTVQTIYDGYLQRLRADVAYTTFLEERADLLAKFKNQSGFNFFDGTILADQIFRVFESQQIDPPGWGPFPLILK